ncbi:hypothetical protein DFQ30_007581, partial [Apophysomyces sp. BC1015]
FRRSSSRPVPPRRQAALANLLSSSRLQDSELDRRLQSRLTEKETILAQLEDTVSWLDQFLSARSALGSDIVAMPSFLLQQLPSVLATAATVTSPTPPSIDNNTSLRDMVDRLLQIPPYSTRLHLIESNIISAHRRIREQLASLGTSVESQVLSTISTHLEHP